jgi:hypothetical protein
MSIARDAGSSIGSAGSMSAICVRLGRAIIADRNGQRGHGGALGVWVI